MIPDVWRGIVLGLAVAHLATSAVIRAQTAPDAEADAAEDSASDSSGAGWSVSETEESEAPDAGPEATSGAGPAGSANAASSSAPAGSTAPSSAPAPVDLLHTDEGLDPLPELPPLEPATTDGYQSPGLAAQRAAEDAERTEEPPNARVFRDAERTALSIVLGEAVSAAWFGIGFVVCLFRDYTDGTYETLDGETVRTGREVTGGGRRCLRASASIGFFGGPAVAAAIADARDDTFTGNPLWALLGSTIGVAGALSVTLAADLHPGIDAALWLSLPVTFAVLAHEIAGRVAREDVSLGASPWLAPDGGGLNLGATF